MEFYCPMHSDVRRADAGACPKCGMQLVAAGTRFALLKHMVSSPQHLFVMLVAMAAAMTAVMFLLH